MSHSTASSTDAKGFFAALFDFGFTSFITLKFLKLIYGAAVAVILLAGFLMFAAAMVRGGSMVLVALFVVPVITLFYLVLARVGLEAVALFFRIGENTSVLAGRGSLAGAPVAGGYGPLPTQSPAGAPLPATPSQG